MVTSNEGNDQLPLVKERVARESGRLERVDRGLPRREWDCT